MNKKLIVLICLVCCILVPNVKGIKRIEETHYFNSSNTGVQYNQYVQKGEFIKISYETYDEPFNVIFWLDSSVIFYEYSNRVFEFEVLKSHRMYFVFQRGGGESKTGYIHIIIENQIISSFPLFLILGIIGVMSSIIYFKNKKRCK